MKTAISIPDDIFKYAEETAKKLGMSRSALFTKAIEEFIQTYRSKLITVALDELYGKESSGLDPELARMQAISLGEERWE